MTKVTVEVSGPWFHKEIRDSTIHRYCERVEDKIGEVGVTMIEMYLPTRFKYKTPDPHPGLYLSNIHAERSVTDHLMILDTPVVYGPWLEGVGSRNFPVTRFRGYHAFRKVAQGLNSFAVPIAEEELSVYVEELNA